MSQVLNETPGNSASTPITGHEHQRLFYLHDLEDFKVHHDDTDVRTWPVKLADGTTLGSIRNLVVDKGERQVRYLEVSGDDSFYNDHNNRDYYLDKSTNTASSAASDTHFLLPIGMSTIDHSDHCVRIGDVRSDVFTSVPRYRGGTSLTPMYEIETLNHYNRQKHTLADNSSLSRYDKFDHKRYKGLDDSFYSNPYFDSGKYSAR